MKEKLMNINVNGHVLITDGATGEVLLDKKNAIHPQNMATVLARGLAREDSTPFWVSVMALGNGGTHIDTNQQITYLTPNTTGIAATLYNQTYSEVIDDSNAACPTDNFCRSSPSDVPAITSVVTCQLTLSANEPAGQATSDGITTNPDSLYTFDELGLLTEPINGQPLLLTHVIFSPIEKTANRSIVITYTLTVAVS